ncbi:MAG: large subunit ribosomal protein L30 [Gammaproteobacteria bacterium]|jgi:large subunit ribosomal protein L30
MADEKKTVKKAAVKKVAVKKAAAPAVDKVEAGAEEKVVARKAAPKKAAAAKSTAAMVTITLIKSKHGRLASHKACVAGLGLRRMHQTVQVIDTPENRGMINKVQYLLKIEEA